MIYASTFLYWGEGDKTSRCTLSIYNTDPVALKFALVWMVKSLHIPKEKIRVRLHLYRDMDIDEEIAFWSKELHIPRTSFCKPYFKASMKADLDRKGFGHGTCGLLVNNTEIKERLLMAMKGIAEDVKEKLERI